MKVVKNVGPILPSWETALWMREETLRRQVEKLEAERRLLPLAGTLIERVKDITEPDLAEAMHAAARIIKMAK
jgi:hypothetical protein